MIRPLTTFLAIVLPLGIGELRAHQGWPDEGHSRDREGLSWGAELSVHSTFIYRSLALSDGPIAQPYAYLSFENFTLDAYATPSLNDTDGLGHLIEFGVSAGYDGFTFSEVSVAPTFFLYGIPEDGSVLFSGELELLLGLELGPVEIYLENALGLIHRDERLGFWSELGISHETNFTPALSLASKLGVAAATRRWNRFNAEAVTRRFGFNGLDIESTLEYAISAILYTSLTGEMVLPFLRTLAGGDAVIVNVGAAFGARW
jgi:hypothetical protein